MIYAIQTVQDVLREGYRTLRTPDGAANGYAALSVFGDSLEARVRIDRMPGSARDAAVYLTGEDRKLLFALPAAAPGAAARGAGRIRFADLSALDVTRALTLEILDCAGTQPIASAVLYEAPTPASAAKPEPEETPVSAAATAPEPEETAASAAATAPEPEETAAPEVQEAPESEETPAPEVQEAPAAEEAPAPEPDAVLRTLIPFDPFRTTNPAYKWWICPDRAHLQALLQSAALTLPATLQMTLTAALGRYGHLLAGRYDGDRDGRTLLILGVPARSFGRDPDTAAGSTRWIPVLQKYPSETEYNGYLAYYFDLSSGRAIRAIVRG